MVSALSEDMLATDIAGNIILYLFLNSNLIIEYLVRKGNIILFEIKLDKECRFVKHIMVLVICSNLF